MSLSKSDFLNDFPTAYFHTILILSGKTKLEEKTSALKWVEWNLVHTSLFPSKNGQESLQKRYVGTNLG